MDKTLLKLSKLPYFRTSHLEALLPYLKKPSLYQKISRWLSKGEIIELKKGYYVTKEYKENNISHPNYLSCLANILRYPSYVSGTYILNKYDILTEVTYPITSITTKTTRIYTNKLGSFIYYSISPKLYRGYERLFFNSEPIYVASLSKALFDYLYIKYSRRKIKADEIIARERLNLENFKKNDIKEFKEYCRLSNKKNLLKLGLKLFK
jgi:hypothetical protein